MAVVQMNIPWCDNCQRPWLPDSHGRTADSKERMMEITRDPRAYNRKLVAQGKVGLRCGKCKSKLWDREYEESLKAGGSEVVASICAPIASPETRDALVEVARAVTNMIRCEKHGLLDCPECASAGRKG